MVPAPQETKMAEQTLVPDEDVSVAWTPTPGPDNYEAINGGIGSGDDTEYVSTDVNGTADQYGFPDALVNTGYTYEINLDIRFKTTIITNVLRIELFIDSVSQGTQDISPSIADTIENQTVAFVLARPIGAVRANTITYKQTFIH